VTYASPVTLYRLSDPGDLIAPTLVAAFDSWIDAGSASTTAANQLVEDGDVIVTFDADSLFDYRARRPTLEIVDGRPTELTWPELVIKRSRISERDILVLSGPEPDYRWRAFRAAIVEMSLELGVVESVCLGAIPATVAHTRPTPILMTGKDRRPLDTDPPLPAEHMRVPAAAVNLIELHLSEHGIPSVGIWAQVPHYVAGMYQGGVLALVQRVEAHLGVSLSVEALVEAAREERERLDAIVAERPDAREYLAQLEEAEPPRPIPSGEDIAAEVERFLQDWSGERPNPFENPPPEPG